MTAQADNTNRTCATAAVYPAFGQTVAGRVSTYLNGTTLTRDFDYWRMPAVAQPTTVTFRLYGEFPVDYLWQSYAVDCNSTPTTLLGAVRLACTSTFIGTVTLQPGVINTLRISAPDFQGLPCPNFNDYRLTVNVVPQGACCVTATACFVESAANCATQSGTVSQTAFIRGRGSSYRGTFYNPEFDTSGRIQISVSGRSQVVRLTSNKGSAVIRLSRN